MASMAHLLPRRLPQRLLLRGAMPLLRLHRDRITSSPGTHLLLLTSQTPRKLDPLPPLTSPTLPLWTLSFLSATQTATRSGQTGIAASVHAKRVLRKLMRLDVLLTILTGSCCSRRTTRVIQQQRASQQRKQSCTTILSRHGVFALRELARERGRGRMMVLKRARRADRERHDVSAIALRWSLPRRMLRLQGRRRRWMRMRGMCAAWTLRRGLRAVFALRRAGQVVGTTIKIPRLRLEGQLPALEGAGRSSILRRRRSAPLRRRCSSRSLKIRSSTPLVPQVQCGKPATKALPA